jgi:spore germination protein YaaH
MTPPTPQQTATPRTDGAAFQTKIPVPTVEGDVYEFVRADFSRTLERDLATAEAELAKMREIAKRLAESLRDCVAAYETEYKAVGEWHESVDLAKKENLI